MSSSKTRSFKRLKCRLCSNIVERVDVKADSVVCSQCLSKAVRGELDLLTGSSIHSNNLKE
jgi:hypothetical protein